MQVTQPKPWLTGHFINETTHSDRLYNYTKSRNKWLEVTVLNQLKSWLQDIKILNSDFTTLWLSFCDLMFPPLTEKVGCAAGQVVVSSQTLSLHVLGVWE